MTASFQYTNGNSKFEMSSKVLPNGMTELTMHDNSATTVIRYRIDDADLLHIEETEGMTAQEAYEFFASSFSPEVDEAEQQ